jgi:hypothetical protein
MTSATFLVCRPALLSVSPTYPTHTRSIRSFRGTCFECILFGRRNQSREVYTSRFHKKRWMFTRSALLCAQAGVHAGEHHALSEKVKVAHADPERATHPLLLPEVSLSSQTNSMYLEWASEKGRATCDPRSPYITTCLSALHPAWNGICRHRASRQILVRYSSCRV